ncbi:short-chain fatty acyl-CoA regulator family protein [Devosia algicola]|uniref:Short-chain fatty acyl-CoA regulator family protein n=1 Tax=Devosia algicola TaxID=3026418 RepID=A0ABY7YL78_9HYPH|nr:helix-turn-helix transcriptional regulator [Devosia algicola]WDR02061.1 short-chain fatty acyl-CoA regulator family protein [Devosia algicola]
MRAPIGIRITTRRKAKAISQAELARRVEISPSYLNLIERNKRDVGGALLLRIAGALDVEIDSLTGESEQRLMADVEEAFADPALQQLGGTAPDSRQLVAEQPVAAEAIARLHRAYVEATANADNYADRLRSDPLFSQLLHQILSSITAVRSSAEILEDMPDLGEHERKRFRTSIGREARSLSEVAHTLIGHFDREARTNRSSSPVRELDDLIYQSDNHFPTLEAAASDLRADIDERGAFGEAALLDVLARKHGVSVTRSAGRKTDALGFPGQYHFNAEQRIMWFQTSSMASTRQFQLTRLLVELSATDLIETEIANPILHSQTARRLGYRALTSYLAGAVVFPYERFLADAEATHYDIEALRQIYTASFEQVAHRLTTLRRPGAAGVPFGFLRADPAGRLTKHFPLPGLLLPNTGHACPLWAIYAAFRAPDHAVRQIVRFTDGSRYLFLAKTAARRAASFRDRAIHTSTMLACDVLHADRTVYAAGLDLADEAADLPVGPSCRLCTRRDCPDRQEETLAPGGGQAAVRAPFLPRSF